MKILTRYKMLQMMDIRTLPNGKPQIFAVKFVQKDGKLRFFPQCTVGGAGRMDNKVYRMRGLTPCDCIGAPIDHTYAVRIDNIIECNGFRIVSRLEDNQ